MTKWDKILIVCLMAASVLLIVPILQGQPVPSQAVVSVRNEEKLRLNLAQNGSYSVKGTLGPVNIEVQDGSVRVTQENSPHHYCSRQGWVNSTAVPIVCLPNETVIRIQGESGSEDTVIQ
ncbi:NusG domain II-containing protein [uncultured Faecalibaculum sp.]|uniref:NusG domain II-containing protein n=1 Tax=uncultured Faecalibaculum sp. TaxID=1729681 RepID=UPI0025F81A17|nr:NusG domain II-containing protein [uncultured Faecalibaculum sp.]